jgi:hypothetical protein
MKDVRAEKRNEKSPDFSCLQQNGQCGKPSKDGKKWFPTAKWADKTPAHAVAATIRDRVDEAFDQFPKALQQEGGDDLPF